MRNSFTKYPFKIFTFAIIIGFLFSSISLCSMIIINCETEEVSCCTAPVDVTQPLTNEEGCCCIITEAPRQPAEITPAAKDLIKKQISYATNYYNESFDITTQKLTINKNFSFHSPPVKDVCILNSIFRI